jgi:Kdo2-lipid IVA lauroyltransferase/acyltransferase
MVCIPKACQSLGERIAGQIAMNVFNAFLTGLISTLFWMIGCIPASIADSLARAGAGLWFRIDKKHRNIAIQNLTRAFGHEKSPEQIQVLAAKSFYNILRIPFEIGWSDRLTLPELYRHAEIFGLHHVQAALAKGKGVLGLTAHIGNWELLPSVAPMAGFSADIIYRPLDFFPLDAFFLRLRTRFGAGLIPNTHAMRKILRQLKHGHFVAMLMDQNVDWYEGVFVEFFNHRACTNKGFALLALKTGAPVVPIFMVRNQRRFIIEFCPELELVQTGDRTHDVEANTLRYNQAIESMIRRYPDQWFWVHQRWKTRPFCPWPKLQ